MNNATNQTNLDITHRPNVIARELAWHEEEAERRYGLDHFLYAPPAFDMIVHDMLNFLTAKPNDAVIDIACGEGKETLAMAQRGWIVFAIDLSHAQLVRARNLIQAIDPNLSVHFIQANAEQMPFAPNSFKVMYGKAIIHHLDLEISANEVNRVLQSDGQATFAEPMAHHPLFWLARRLTPKMRTADEHPLTYAEFTEFLNNFPQGTIEENFLLAPLAYIFRIIPRGEALFMKTHRLLTRFDKWLLNHFKFLKPLAWYDVVYLQTRKS